MICGFPFRRVMRLIGADGLGTAHNGAQFVHRRNIAQRHGLGQQIADGRALDGAGDDGPVDGVRDKLIEQLILAAAADDVQRVDTLALDLLQTLERPAVFERERFIDAPRDLPDGLRYRLVRLAAERPEFSRPSGLRQRIRRSRDR